MTEYHPPITRRIALLTNGMVCYYTVMNIVSNHCVVCRKILRGRQTKYCSSHCKNNVNQCYEIQKARGIKRKLELVMQRGGACSICGYKRNLGGLTFHHTKSEKKFQLDMRSLSNRTLKRVQKEIKKCILICANCHAELHYPYLNLAKLSIKPTALPLSYGPKKLNCKRTR